MIDREAVREMARREYNLNHSAEQAFDRISRELNLGKPSSTFDFMVLMAFYLLEESKHLKSAAANKKFSMLSDNIQRIIADEYRQQQTKIACWTTSDIQALRLLSSRYSIGLRRMSDSEETNLLKFYDNFHGQERLVLYYLRAQTRILIGHTLEKFRLKTTCLSVNVTCLQN